MSRLQKLPQVGVHGHHGRSFVEGSIVVTKNLGALRAVVIAALFGFGAGGCGGDE